MDYRTAVEEFNVAVVAYQSLLGEHVLEERVRMVLHDSEEYTEKGYISSEEKNDLVDEGTDFIITYHCAQCDQQIDVIVTD